MKLLGLVLITAARNVDRITSRIVMTFLVASTLAACGGGGDHSSGGQANGPNIHADVPSSGASKITSISTPAGIVERDQAIVRPSQVGDAGYLILATDANDDLFLAALADPAESAAPMLSLESTAEALAIIGQGRLPAGVSRSDFVQAVRRSEGFPGLIDSIRKALDGGIPPRSDPQFWQALSKVLSQALPSPTATASSARSEARQSLARPSAKLPLPAVVIDGLIGDLAVTGPAPGVNGLIVSNGLPTHFAARGETIDTGTDLGTLQSYFGQAQVLVDARSLDSFQLSVDAEVPGNGEVWNLHIFKSQRAKWRDGVGILEDLFEVLARDLFASECIERVGETIITANWATLGLAGSAEDMRGALVDSLYQASTWTTVRSVLTNCSVNLPLEKQAQAVAKFVAGVPLKLPSLVLSGANIVTKGVYSGLYWDLDTRIGVCQGRDQSSQQLEIVPCVAKLSPSVPELNMQLGERRAFDLMAFDEDDNALGVTDDLRVSYSSSANDQITVDERGVITAVAETGAEAAPVQITATSGKYGLTATMSIRVVAAPPVTASLTVSRSQINLGESVEVTWNSTNASACTGDGAWSGPASVAGTMTLTPTEAGALTFRLQCNGNGQVATAQAVLQVLEPGNGGTGSETLIAYEDGLRTALAWQINPQSFNQVGGRDQNGQFSEACLSRMNAPSPDPCQISITYIVPESSSPLGSYPILFVVIGNGPAGAGVYLRYSGSDRQRPGFPANGSYLGEQLIRLCDPAPGVAPCATTLSSYGISIDSVNRRIYFSQVVLEGIFSVNRSGDGFDTGDVLQTRTVLDGWLPY